VFIFYVILLHLTSNIITKMNDLEKYFYGVHAAPLQKWSHYFDIYDRHFSAFRNKDIVILEIGVENGGSLLMWRHYFGEKAKIYGVDIDPECANLNLGNNIEIIIGSQSDREFLRELKNKIPKIDILIDDGGHHMEQQIITFEELFDHISDDGIYLCEDLHTSYWYTFGGGYKNPNSFIEYSKNFIDYLNATVINIPELQPSEFTKHVYGLHYYDSVLVIEKQLRKKPVPMYSGRL
jgi:cephalosporin hydroxylase